MFMISRSGSAGRVVESFMPCHWPRRRLWRCCAFTTIAPPWLRAAPSRAHFNALQVGARKHPLTCVRARLHRPASCPAARLTAWTAGARLLSDEALPLLRLRLSALADEALALLLLGAGSSRPPLAAERPRSPSDAPAA